MYGRRLTRLIGVLAVVVLAATACSVSTDDESTTPTQKEETGEQEQAAPRDTRAINAPARGVTADTIRIGVSATDVNKVKSTFGVDLGELPDEVFPALAKATNDAGGINGRQVELFVDNSMPIGSEDSERACRELIEDKEVFAVLGMWLNDAPLCATETFQTPYIALWGLSPERIDRSIAPFVSMMQVDVMAAQTQAAIDEGLFEGKKVAVYHEGAQSPDVVRDEVLDPLEAAGIEVVSTAQLPSSGDAVQGATEIDRIFQRFQADGADTVVVAGSGAGVVVPAIGRTNWEPDWVFLANGQFLGEDALPRYGLTDPTELIGARVVMGNLTSDDVVDDADFLDCVERINSNSSLDMKADDIYPAALRPGSPGLFPVVQACQLWDLAMIVLAAAGDDPTPQSLLDGLDDIGPFQLAGFSEASLASDKWGAVNPVRTWTYDLDEVRFVPDGPIAYGTN